ncbi:MAG: putative response regulator, CheY [Ramlibacter sp.]|nr:putative response regulator, CheY [Ramlibacter sp.]
MTEIRVFVVDDAMKMRGTLGELLSAIGNFRVVASATTEAEANLWLDEHPGGWDLAVIDLLLEEGSGLGVIARCRAHAQRGTVVVFSGYATPGVRGRCMELGAAAVFDKSDLQGLLDFCTDMANPPLSAA